MFKVYFSDTILPGEGISTKYIRVKNIKKIAKKRRVM